MAKDSFNEKDWKLYRSKIAEWQEAYMERLTKEYMELLSRDDAASDKFWELVKRIKADKKRVGVSVHLSRSEMMYQFEHSSFCCVLCYLQWTFIPIS